MTSQNTSVLELLVDCMLSKSGLYVIPSFTVVWTLLPIPLWSLVFYTVFQRWRQNKRSTVSHSDFFTYHTFLFEFFTYSGFIILTCALLQYNFLIMASATYIIVFASPGLLFLHTLTCVERYLAVVYPVIYLSLKQRRCIWIRNGIIFIIWVICSLWICMLMFVVPVQHIQIPLLILLGIITSIISFCCVQVLRTLRNPSPGEGQHVSQSKQRAFYTVFTILSALLLWMTGSTVSASVSNELLKNVLFCTLKNCAIWFQLPSTVVLPLLFLHRAGKLPKCRAKKSNKTIFLQVFKPVKIGQQHLKEQQATHSSSNE